MKATWFQQYMSKDKDCLSRLNDICSDSKQNLSEIELAVTMHLLPSIKAIKSSLEIKINKERKDASLVDCKSEDESKLNENETNVGESLLTMVTNICNIMKVTMNLLFMDKNHVGKLEENIEMNLDLDNLYTDEECLDKQKSQLLIKSPHDNGLKIVSTKVHDWDALLFAIQEQLPFIKHVTNRVLKSAIALGQKIKPLKKKYCDMIAVSNNDNKENVETKRDIDNVSTHDRGGDANKSRIAPVIIKESIPILSEFTNQVNDMQLDLKSFIKLFKHFKINIKQPLTIKSIKILDEEINAQDKKLVYQYVLLSNYISCIHENNDDYNDIDLNYNYDMIVTKLIKPSILKFMLKFGTMRYEYDGTLVNILIHFDKIICDVINGYCLKDGSFQHILMGISKQKQYWLDQINNNICPNIGKLMQHFFAKKNQALVTFIKNAKDISNDEKDFDSRCKAYSDMNHVPFVKIIDQDVDAEDDGKEERTRIDCALSESDRLDLLRDEHLVKHLKTDIYKIVRKTRQKEEKTQRQGWNTQKTNVNQIGGESINIYNVKLAMDQDIDKFNLCDFVAKYCEITGFTPDMIQLSKIEKGSVHVYFNVYQKDIKIEIIENVFNSVQVLDMLREEFSVYSQIVTKIPRSEKYSKKIIDKRIERARKKMRSKMIIYSECCRKYGTNSANGEIFWVGSLKDHISRGGKKYPYYCPVGWKKYALSIDNLGYLRFDIQFGDWPIAYHGTNFYDGMSIVMSGFEPAIQAVHNINGFYVTPSIIYASHPRYSPPTIIPNKHRHVFIKDYESKSIDENKTKNIRSVNSKMNEKDNHKQLHIQFVLQLRINPKVLNSKNMLIAPQTLGYSKTFSKIDPNYSNDQLEWLIKGKKSEFWDVSDPESKVICSGIMVRTTDKSPKYLKESKWWQDCSKRCLPQKEVIFEQSPKFDAKCIL